MKHNNVCLSLNMLQGVSDVILSTCTLICLMGLIWTYMGLYYGVNLTLHFNLMCDIKLIIEGSLRNI